MAISFHPDAVGRFNELGNGIRDRLLKVKPPPAPPTSSPLYPAAQLKSEDVIGETKTKGDVVDAAGNIMGKIWQRGDKWAALPQDACETVKTLAQRLERTPDLAGRVTIAFLIDVIFEWLANSSFKSDATLIDHIAARCTEEIQEFEMCSPLFYVFSSEDFWLDDVCFRTLPVPMIEEYFNAAGREPPELVVKQRLDKIRSSVQGMLTACVKVRAERTMAKQLALTRTLRAVSLLRFLSPINWTPGVRSYCLPVGLENTEVSKHFMIFGNKLTSYNERGLPHGPLQWNVDTERSQFPDLLSLLHRLASQTGNDFGDALLDAMLLYSRNSLTPDIADKLVFVLVSLESLLLKDSNEPITKNIGERMAFLIGNSVGERREILKNVDDTYRIRSAFIHHGDSPADLKTVSVFFGNAWSCFVALLRSTDRYSTKPELINTLEERKLS
jgi:hypothetical protein